MENYMNPNLTPGERAQDLLAQLSLEEKMAQIRGIFPMQFEDDPEEKWIEGRGIGQISCLITQMGETTLEQAIAWQNRIQEKVLRESPHHIPAAFHMEGVNGSYFHGSVNYPTGVSRGASFDPTLEREIGQNVARNELAAGITQILSPVLDVARDPRMGRCGESYGEDPALASAMGSAYTTGLQEEESGGRHAAATAKHFVGFHSSRGGIHGGGSSLGERELREIYGRSFQAAMTEAHLKGIMPCYNVIDGIPFSSSPRYLTGLLREEMGFDGVTVSDYNAVSQVYDVKKVGENYADAGFYCLSAGMDVELPSPLAYGEELEERFRSGEADMAVLDRAVLRILTEKFRMGLFEHPFGDLDLLKEALLQEKGTSTARRAAAESIILLKNNGVLPLQAGKLRKVAVIGPHAVNARFYFGGYTHLSMMESSRAARNSLAGVGSGDQKLSDDRLIPGTKVQKDNDPTFDEVLQWVDPECRSLLAELQERFPGTDFAWAEGYPIAGASEAGFDEALSLIQSADLVIATLGGKHGTGSIATMGEGIDATDINLPACQDAFLRKAAAFGKPIVGIHFGGRPVSSDAADQYTDALIEAFCPASYTAQVLTDVLFGLQNPSGKLPVSIAYNAGQVPVVYSHENGSCWHQAMSIGFPDYVDCSHHPRYAFGHGLSYTTFEYSNLKISAEEIAPDQEIIISCDIANTGTREGTEIVQLYLADECASVTRPNMELQGAARVCLAPDEKKTVHFHVNPSVMAFLDREMKWKIEKGRFLVMIGAASDDIRLEGAYTVTADQFIDGKCRAFYAKAEIV
ncbi:MAG: glycoside hydrolase family 3 C-terminal domain-containing protein [Lachnospiraceae bacterium]|nr:glycoside hydrolase family 3 C-terminal domain-containing protein [Lachnospiraceae bacterium]